VIVVGPDRSQQITCSDLQGTKKTAHFTGLKRSLTIVDMIAPGGGGSTVVYTFVVVHGLLILNFIDCCRSLQISTGSK